MLYGCISSLVTLVLLIGAVSTQETNVFVEPTPGADPGEYSQNNVYVEGSEVQVRWRTNFSILSLTLYQDRTGHTWIYLPSMKDVSTTTFYRWTVSRHGFNITASNVFYFSVWHEDGSKEHFNSHYFNITSRDPSPSPSPSASQSTSTATSTSQPTLIAPPSDPSSSKLSKGTKIAIGVGASSGALALFAIGLIIYLIHRNRQKQATEQGAYSTNSYYAHRTPPPLPPPPGLGLGMQMQGEGSVKEYPLVMPQQQYQHEMESPVVGHGVRVELPAGKEVVHSRGELVGEGGKRVDNGDSRDSNWI